MKYFRGKAGGATFALTTQVLMYPEWTPEIVKAGQDELIKVYRNNLNL